MPLRDFTCRACGQAFEKLVRHEETVACPGCGSTELRQELSAFAVGPGGEPMAMPMPMPGGCGSCGMDPATCGFEPEH